jgi:hypothetical protein
MIGILDHKWGVSSAQDRVWAQVSGLSPHAAGRRLFVVLQAFVDDSYTQNGTFVLAGYIASAEAWVNFSKDWEQLLPLTNRGPSGKWRFKMREMARRMRDVIPFHRVIEQHALIAISCKINLIDLARAKSSILAENVSIDWGFMDNPFWLSIQCLMDMFHKARAAHSDHPVFGNLLPLDQKVDFYFDDHTKKRAILGAWDDYLLNRGDDVRGLYGVTPRFENDEEFMPLQAADFWAWLVRKGYENGTIQQLQAGDFGEWTASKLIPSLAISFSEDELCVDLVKIVRDFLRRENENRPIFRVRFSVNGQRL